MGKVALKERISVEQDHKCALTGRGLPWKTECFDIDRKIPKAAGGLCVDKNTRMVIPSAHMKLHGIYRKREEAMENLKATIDARRNMLKLRIKISNQILSFERETDSANQEIVTELKDSLSPITARVKDLSSDVAEALKLYQPMDPLARAALGVRSVGPMTVAHCLVYIDIEKARHASSLWAYAGLDKPSHKRYTKGVSGGGNKTLRTCLYTMADSQMKGRGPYREIYDRVKNRLSISDKVVESRDTKGLLIKCAWKSTKPCHRHGAALRAIMKHYLADYWFVGRTLQGLDTSPLYAESMLGRTHKTIAPEERGWVY